MRFNLITLMFFSLILRAPGQDFFARIPADTIYQDSIRVFKGELFPLSVTDSIILFGSDALLFADFQFDSVSFDSLPKFIYVFNGKDATTLGGENLSRIISKDKSSPFDRIIIEGYPSIFLREMEVDTMSIHQPSHPTTTNFTDPLNVIIALILGIILGVGISSFWWRRRKKTVSTGSKTTEKKSDNHIDGKNDTPLTQASTKPKGKPESTSKSRITKPSARRRQSKSVKIATGANFGEKLANLIIVIQDAVNQCQIEEDSIKAETPEGSYQLKFWERFKTNYNENLLDRWQKVADQLGRNKMVEDPDLVDVLLDMHSETDKLRTLRKYVYFDLIKPLIPLVFILLEEFKNTALFLEDGELHSGQQKEGYSQFEDSIFSILDNLKSGFGVSLHYVPLMSNLMEVSGSISGIDSTDHPDYYRHLLDKADQKGARIITEIVSYGMDSEFEQKDTIVKVTA